MRATNNKTTYSILSEQLDNIREEKVAKGKVSKNTLETAEKAAKVATAMRGLLEYELRRSIKTNQPLREVESKPFDNTI